MFTALYAFRALSQESTLINSIPGGQRLRHCSAMLIGLSGVLTEAKKAFPSEGCQLSSWSHSASTWSQTACKQRAISSKPCPPSTRLSGEVYFAQDCHHSQSKCNKGSIYCLKYIGLYFFFFCSIGHWLQGLVHGRQAFSHWAAPIPYLFLLMSGFSQRRLFWIFSWFLFRFSIWQIS